MREELVSRIQKHKFLASIPLGEIEIALRTAEQCFSDEYQFLDDKILLDIKKREKSSFTIDVLDNLLPALIFAHRYFGQDMPDSLIQKLLNKSQIEDTLFELKCMGIFMGKHKIFYEPKLSNGKVPEFKINLEGFPDIFVECKSQNLQDSEYSKKFNKVSSSLMNALGKGNFIKDAWTNGYRVEVFLLKYLDDKEVDEAVGIFEKTKFSESMNQRDIIVKNLRIVCIPREEQPTGNAAIRLSSITVGDKPTRWSYENTHLMVNCWNSVGIQIRRSQRKLLKEARKKLKMIPKGTVGMICIQTYGVDRFFQDVQKLLLQNEYSSTPIIWVNPFHERKIICRNEFLGLRDELFQGLLTNDD